MVIVVVVAVGSMVGSLVVVVIVMVGVVVAFSSRSTKGGGLWSCGLCLREAGHGNCSLCAFGLAS
jgi:hypothetical protein